MGASSRSIRPRNREALDPRIDTKKAFACYSLGCIFVKTRKKRKQHFLSEKLQPLESRHIKRLKLESPPMMKKSIQRGATGPTS